MPTNSLILAVFFGKPMPVVKQTFQ